MSFFDDLASIVQQQPTAGLSPDQQRALDLSRASGISDVIGQSMGAASHLMFGIQAKQAADYQADQLRENAGQVQAGAQRQAADEDRRTQLVNSAALASAAASGGGVSDPTVVNIMARTAGEGAYRRAVALYQGDDRARLMDMQADAKQYEGGNTEVNSALVAGSQIFKGGTTLLDSEAQQSTLLKRFGAGGWKANGPRG